MIRQCNDVDFQSIYEVINDAASAYKGVIPEDRWQEPYMSKAELREQIGEGVRFWCFTEGPKTILGAMGIQDKGEVALIRHAYVRTPSRNKGIGSALLEHLVASAGKPVLVGTWADAAWAIRFYEKHGFRRVSPTEKETLLRRFWRIPDRQVQTSVVLASPDWTPAP